MHRADCYARGKHGALWHRKQERLLGNWTQWWQGQGHAATFQWSWDSSPGSLCNALFPDISLLLSKSIHALGTPGVASAVRS